MSEPTIWEIAMGGKPPEKFVPYEEYKKLDLQNAKLKIEVERYSTLVGVVHSDLTTENARLKSEVERLTLHIELDEVDRRNGLCCDAKYRFEELEAQVERLTKAGDAMQEQVSKHLIYNHGLKVNNDWHYAKNGGQPSSEKDSSFIEDLGDGVEKHDLKFRIHPAAKNGGQS
jgi:hypothetical protein